MKKLFLLTLFFAWPLHAQVGIGTATPDESALLDLSSTSKGLLLPRLSSTERNLINNATEGLTIYNTDSKALEFFDGTNWNKVLMERVVIETLYQNVLNGSFEEWENSQAKAWTIVDAEIDTEQETSIVHSGTSSLKVTLNTVNQDLTDFRQKIMLEKGTYEVSFYVYHLDDASRVRLYAGAFKNYSDSSLLNQWQEVTSEFTITEDQEVEMGFRFYDTSQFTNSSVVYLDNMQLTKK